MTLKGIMSGKVPYIRAREGVQVSRRIALLGMNRPTSRVCTLLLPLLQS
jgi:hypothetical protein